MSLTRQTLCRHVDWLVQHACCGTCQKLITVWLFLLRACCHLWPVLCCSKFCWLAFAQVYNCAVHADGRSPLHLAALKGHSTVVRFLLSKQAWADAQDGEDSTALHLAARFAAQCIVAAFVCAKHVIMLHLWALSPAQRCAMIRRRPSCLFMTGS